MIINLTQHKATPEQLDAGVVDLPDSYRTRVIEALTFDEIPDGTEIAYRVNAIAFIVSCYILGRLCPTDSFKDITKKWGDNNIEDENVKVFNHSFMIGGAPFLMSTLEEELSYLGTVLYAFSKRVSMDGANGEKVSKFKHIGFVKANI